MTLRALRRLARITGLAAVLVLPPRPMAEPSQPMELGRSGGSLAVGLQAEPKTLNPLIATDNASRSLLSVMMADLIHINRVTQLAEPSLAESVEVSADGRTYDLRLRDEVFFSDGHPLDVEDVLFSFELYLDESLHSSQRDLLILDGEATTVEAIDARTIRFRLPKPYGPGERLFDGFAILPKHVLEEPYQNGELDSCWTLGSEPTSIVGLGPFRLKRYFPGERLVLERNPYYWKRDADDRRLPYLDELVFLVTGDQATMTMRFQSGALDIIERPTAQDYALLAADGELDMRDQGPGLEYNFLFFNLNDLEEADHPALHAKQTWFRDREFRRAVSFGIDRRALVELVYDGRATPLASQVSPGNRLWFNQTLEPDEHRPERARALLKAAGFGWSQDRRLVDPSGRRVSFSILLSSSNTSRTKMATLIQQDLSELGIQVDLVSQDFGSFVDRLFQTRDYEACLLGLVSGDTDPNSEINVWSSGGTTHLWRLGGDGPANDWEAELDRLMRAQMVTTDGAERKRLYDRVQQIVAEERPLIQLVSPNILVGASRKIGNFRPAVMTPYAIWNVEELFLKESEPASQQ